MYKNLTDKELKDLKISLEKEISSLNNQQQATKIANNSLYGALSNVYFRFFNIEFARAITLTGQTIIQDVSGNLNNYLNQSIKTDNYPYIFYNDTDSVEGSSLVYVNDEQIPISELYDKYKTNLIYEDNFNKSFVGSVGGATTKTINMSTGVLQENAIKYVMKHRVKKRMYKINIGDKSVTVTEDHSIIVFRNNRLMSVSPKDITDKDRLIKIS